MSDESSLQYTIVVDGRSYIVEVDRLRGVDIRALSGVPASNALVLESDDAREDLVIDDESVVDLDTQRPVRVYSRPPTMHGAPQW
ncbi:multiubiquitin domain-containing protein [Ramlibacter monticola]|uniref:Multiubiquitin domain-containing protein n=1 Tax=Ramlibacter monticola TaxID=1926872 RepID=A0A936YYI5_9BURK|nr:multiubiquitin domain-containing protein [Ramlibacter monticola]